MRDISEAEEKEVCRCGDDKCRFAPLKHLERCPRCFSEAWHQRIDTNKEESK